QTLGKAQQATALEALKAITIDAAYQHFEEDRKGSLAVGKLADLVIVDRNPLTMPSAELKDLKVLQTIKEGQVVYQNPVN
ncbi:MAG: amidohydrolase family protein, partial [Cellvibrionaceae bacterium]|nr:amidohydrolase family protein [Cellvibrionaceae bacterium]